MSLPEVAQGEQLWQSTPAVSPAGGRGRNWTRATEAKIEDASRERVVRAQTSADELGTETRTIREHSKESVGGIKQIEATTLSLVGGLRADLGSLGNVNMTAGAASTITTGKARTDTTGGDFAEDVGGNRTAKVAGNAGDEVAGARNRKIGGDETTTVSGASTEKVGGAKTVTAAQMTFNSESTIGFNAGGGGRAAGRPYSGNFSVSVTRCWRRWMSSPPMTTPTREPSTRAAACPGTGPRPGNIGRSWGRLRHEERLAGNPLRALRKAACPRPRR